MSEAKNTNADSYAAKILVTVFGLAVSGLITLSVFLVQGQNRLDKGQIELVSLTKANTAAIVDINTTLNTDATAAIVRANAERDQLLLKVEKLEQQREQDDRDTLRRNGSNP